MRGRVGRATDGKSMDGVGTRLVRASCRSLLAAAVFAATVAMAGEPPCPDGRPMLPLVRGTSWVYRGRIETTVSKKGSGHVIRRQVTHTMEVRAVERDGRATVALLKGHPRDIPWSERRPPRGAYFLIQSSTGGVYLMREQGGSALEHWRETGELPDRHAMVLDRPLRVGRTFGGEELASQRPDKWYQWHVEAARCVRVRGVPGVDPERLRREYRLAYRTNPADEIVYFVPGLGITRYVYRHHGTVADVDVRLVEFRSPHRISRPPAVPAPSAVAPFPRELFFERG